MKRRPVRWRHVGRYCWRAGVKRGEYWIGARHERSAEAWVFNVFGALVVVRRDWERTGGFMVLP